MPRNKGAKTLTRNQSTERDTIWAAIRFSPTFPLEEIEEATDSTRENIRKYCVALTRCGFLRLTTRADGQPGKQNTYRCIRDNGPKAPSACRDGSVYDPNNGETYQPTKPVQPPSGRQKAWDLMRQRKVENRHFTCEDLAEVMSASGARVYVNALFKAGYLVLIRNSGDGYYIYHLARDTGPKAPIVKRKGSVEDQNTILANAR